MSHCGGERRDLFPCGCVELPPEHHDGRQDELDPGLHTSNGPTIARIITGMVRIAAPMTLRSWYRASAGVALGDRDPIVIGMDLIDVVPDPRHRRPERLHIGAVGHRGPRLLTGEVDDSALDAILLAEDALDPHRARGAGHPFDIESDGVSHGSSAIGPVLA